MYLGGRKILTRVTYTKNLKSEIPLALELANMCVRDHINICWLIFSAFFFLYISECGFKQGIHLMLLHIF